MPTSLPTAAPIVLRHRPRLWRTLAWLIVAMLAHWLGCLTMACARFADRIIGA